MVEVTSFSDKLKDLINKDGFDFAVDLMKELFKTALLGAAVLVVNLFATEQREQKKFNLIKSYEELVKLKDAAKSAGGYFGVISTKYLADRISWLEYVL